MNNLLNALGLDRATQEKLPPNIIQGATIIEGLQGIYSNAPESPKKDILASTIAESVRLLMKEINTFINAGMPEQEPEQIEHKETTPPQEDDNEPTNPNKWRLPTLTDLVRVLNPNKDLIPNFNKEGDYWSNSQPNDTRRAWYYDFKDDATFSELTKELKGVRAVRDFPSDSTDSENWTIIGNLEVWNEDLGEMNWDDAVAEVEKLNNTQETEPTPPTPPTPPKPKGKKPKPPKKRKPEEEHIPQDDYENMDEEELATMLSELEDLLVVLDENDSEYQEVKNEITKIKQYIN